MSEAVRVGHSSLLPRARDEEDRILFYCAGMENFKLKAFLLAAGHGTRLRPLTDKTPKCLLPIRGTPMLEIWLETCRRCGIDEVLINIHAHAELVRGFLRARPSHVRVKVVEERVLLGSAGTLLANRAWVATDPYFWVFYADVLHNVDLAAMRQLHASRLPVATIGVYKVPDPTRCGVVEVTKDGIIAEFVEKPPVPRSNLAFAGLLIAAPELLDAIPREPMVDIGFNVLPQLAGRMIAYPISDYIIDVGTMDNYRKAQDEWPGF
jgi:mannose-1-phosphate guanylyltransferase